MQPPIFFVGHATVTWECGGLSFVSDPLLRTVTYGLQRIGAASSTSTPVPETPDVLLISHLHHDHCDFTSLRRLAPRYLVVPQGAGSFVRRHVRGSHVGEVIELPVGHRWSASPDVSVIAVRADHDGKREPLGPRAAAVGYIVTDGTWSLYFAGDTDVFRGMRQLPRIAHTPLAVALLPVWGWGLTLGPGHMNPERAVTCVDLCEPEIAVPIHWGSLLPVGVAQARHLVPAIERTVTEPAIEFGQRAQARGFGDSVRIVQPGDWLNLDLNGGTS